MTEAILIILLLMCVYYKNRELNITSLRADKAIRGLQLEQVERGRVSRRLAKLETKVAKGLRKPHTP